MMEMHRFMVRVATTNLVACSRITFPSPDLVRLEQAIARNDTFIYDWWKKGDPRTVQVTLLNEKDRPLWQIRLLQARPAYYYPIVEADTSLNGYAVEALEIHFAERDLVVES